MSLRVLYIASSSELGGAERSILNIVRYGDPSRLFPSVLTLMGQGPLPGLAEQAGVQSTSWGLERMSNPILLRRMRTFLREGQFDLVQCFGLRAEVLTRWVAHGMGLKLVSSIRSVDAWRRWRHVALDRLTFDGVTAWISNSEAGKQTWMRREGVPEGRIAVVRSGIPDRPTPGAEVRQRARKKFGIGDEDGPVLAVLANITRAKGHGDLIGALVKLRSRWPRLVCLCAGRDDMGGRFRELAEKAGLGDVIRWLGFIQAPHSVYDAADLAVLASHWEGLPHALIEALRAGLPSVATDVGGVSEIVRDGREGLLCQPRSPDSLSEAINRALEDGEARSAWSEAARRRYEECFRVETMVDRLTGIYEALTARSPRDP